MQLSITCAHDVLLWQLPAWTRGISEFVLRLRSRPLFLAASADAPLA